MGGLVVVCFGLVVLLVIALASIGAVRDHSSQVVAVATSAFSIIGTVVGAYFGLKIGSDGTQAAVAGLRDEAARAQAFAAHVPTEDAEAAIAAAAGLAPGDPNPVPGPRREGGGGPGLAPGGTRPER